MPMNPTLAELYGTNETSQEDLEKAAAAELAEELAENDEVDVDNLSDEQVEMLAAQVLEQTEGEEVAEEETEEDPEAMDKLAEMDFAGRVMAHSYWNELQEIEKTASKADPGFIRKGWKASSDFVKKHGKKSSAIAGGVGGLGAGYAGGRMHQKHKDKKASAEDVLEAHVLARAAEMLDENGWDVEAIDEALTKTAGPKWDAFKKGAKAVPGRAWELLKGGKKGEAGEMLGRRAGNSPKGFKQMTGEALKSTAARAGAGLTVGGAALGAKKLFGKKEKDSSALDVLAERTAVEILEAVGAIEE